MSPISFGLDGLLIMLLLITLFIGLQLNRRLKALRADHAAFATAVASLDQALIRAEGGLAELRTASTQAQAIITARIQEARTAAVRLDELIAKAALIPEPLAAPSFAPRAAEDRGVLELGRPAPVRAAAPAPALAPADGEPQPAAAPIPFEARRDARSRARVDEELFETVAEAFPRLKFAAGGRR